MIKIIKRILRYLRPCLLLFIFSLLLAAMSVAITLIVPILFGDAIDLIVGPGSVSFSVLSPLLVKIAILILAGALSQWVMNLCNNRITFEIGRNIRNDAFHHLQVLPISYHDSHRQGETVSKIITDVETFSDGLLLGFSQFFTAILTILGTLCLMLSIHWVIAVVVVLITPLSLFVASFIARKTHKMFLEQSRSRAKQTAFIDEMISNQKVVKAFGHESEAIADFDEINRELGTFSFKATFYSSLTNPSTRFVNSLVYTGVALVGALACTGNIGLGLSVGQLTCFLSYANQYTKPFNEISGVITELQNALASASRIFELIDAPREKPDASDALTLNHSDHTVEFSNVSFSYSPEKELIKHLDLSIDYGKKVAIVGPTGCGKTTLINLLMRFYDVTDGTIKVDHTDIREITRHSLRSSIGMVLQEPWLKSGTIRDNLILGDESITDDEIRHAAILSHADEFIRRLPYGYDTEIGEGGGILSEGQKQLLCITRVMLRLPPVLILDEATSSIDVRTEMQIGSAFSDMMRGRTTFIVAHRLKTIEEADLILVMRDGNIVEKGNHTSLLAANGFYATLYNSQFDPENDDRTTSMP